LPGTILKIVLILSFVLFAGDDAFARDLETSRPAAADGETQTRQSGARRRRRRTRQRGDRMSQPKDHPPARDAGRPGEAGEPKKVEEVKEGGKTPRPAPRPRRRYDPVLQPPEKAPVP
jgi:hypothetical protein